MLGFGLRYGYQIILVGMNIPAPRARGIDISSLRLCSVPFEDVQYITWLIVQTFIIALRAIF
jgi:hypothetical protein